MMRLVIYLFIVISAAILIKLTFISQHQLFYGAVLCVLFISLLVRWCWPVNYGNRFCRDVLPLLHSLVNYSAHIESKLVQDKSLIQSQTFFSLDYTHYPEWAYESGFNHGLRAGFRFFLIYIERMTDLFIAIDFLTSRSAVNQLLMEDGQLNQVVKKVLQTNVALLSVIIRYIESRAMPSVTFDAMHDLTQLTDYISSHYADCINYLDVDPDNLAIITFSRDLHDLRVTLLQLIAALPRPQN